MEKFVIKLKNEDKFLSITSFNDGTIGIEDYNKADNLVKYMNRLVRKELFEISKKENK